MSYNSLIFIIPLIRFTAFASYVLDSEGIIGGDYAKPNTMTYHVAILSRQNPLLPYTPQCGGGIIADKFAASAIHCFLNESYHIPDISFSVTFATIHFEYLDDLPKVEVETIYSYEFDGNFLSNDLAILKLKESLGIDKNAHLSKLDLPNSDESFGGQIGVVCGFGCVWVETRFDPVTKQTEKIRGLSDFRLKYGDVKVFIDSKCQTHYRQINMSTQFCGGMIPAYPNQQCGICWGDSGNPLVINNKLIGVLSRGPANCSDSINGSVYVRISFFAEFIRSIIHNAIKRKIRACRVQRNVKHVIF